MTREKRRRSFPAKIAVDALLIDKEFTRDIRWPFVSFVRHVFWHKEIKRGHCQAVTKAWTSPCAFSSQNDPDFDGAGLCLPVALLRFR